MQTSWVKRLVGAAAFLACAVWAGCGREQGPEPIVVGMELTYPPFEMRDAQNRPDGIGVRLAEALAEDLKRPLRIEDLRFEGLIPALQTGKIESHHLLDDGDGRTGADDRLFRWLRDERVVHAREQGLSDHWHCGFESGSEDRGGETGTTGHVYARDELPQVRLSVLNHAETCVLEVIQGKADAFIYDQISVYKHWEQHPTHAADLDADSAGDLGHRTAQS